MAERNFKKKKRNNVQRHRKPVMLITGEGKNKTEQLYFSSFNEQHGNYVIRFVKTGLDTDPSRMLRFMKKAWTANGLNTKNGDKAYIVLDLDCDPQKIQKIKSLQKSSKNIKFILSNPCIEVWFILHFKYTTHPFEDSKDPKKELAKYIPGYKENMDISEKIRPYLEKAGENIKKLTEHFNSINIKWGDVDCNPMTEVDTILKELGVL